MLVLSYHQISYLFRYSKLKQQFLLLQQSRRLQANTHLFVLFLPQEHLLFFLSSQFSPKRFSFFNAFREQLICSFINSGDGFANMFLDNWRGFCDNKRECSDSVSVSFNVGECFKNIFWRSWRGFVRIPES